MHDRSGTINSKKQKTNKHDMNNNEDIKHNYILHIVLNVVNCYMIIEQNNSLNI